ncbi:MAG: hypothetical protein NUW00_01635 [Candidatus Kaiserbacteria bacterium]|nr:hypothetical protein [Candidatus Kaiserbacteria bacterium]
MIDDTTGVTPTPEEETTPEVEAEVATPAVEEEDATTEAPAQA